MKVEDCIAHAAEAGFDGIELCLAEEGEFSMETPQAHVRRIARTADAAGLEVMSIATGLYWKYSPTASDPAARRKAFEVAVRQMELATETGANTILYVPGAVNVPWVAGSEVVDYEVAYARARETLLELVEVADRLDVRIGIENVWNKFLLSPLEMRSFIDEIGHPKVGAYLDVGNVLVSGYPEQWVRILGHRILKVHAKDFRTDIGNIHGFTGLLQGDVNWPGVIEALEAVGYDGYITAEIMPPYRHRPERLISDISSGLDAILGR
jgi:hexulose-6-phosphate isomerase